MSNIIVFTGMAHDAKVAIQRQLLAFGLITNPHTGQTFEHPRLAQERQRNIAYLSDRNPEPTLSPETQRRIRRDLQSGRFTTLHDAEDVAHENGFPDPAA